MGVGRGEAGAVGRPVGGRSPVDLLSLLQFLLSMLLEDIQGIVSCQAGWGELELAALLVWFGAHSCPSCPCSFCSQAVFAAGFHCLISGFTSLDSPDLSIRFLPELTVSLTSTRILLPDQISAMFPGSLSS